MDLVQCKNVSIHDRKVILHIRNIAGISKASYKAIELALYRYKKSEGLIPSESPKK